jgi:hypothetical protein
MFSILSHARIRPNQRDPVFNEAQLHVNSCGDTTVKFFTPRARFAPLLLYRRRRSPAYRFRTLSARREEEKMYFLLPGIEPRLLCHSASSIITIPTTLSWLSLTTVHFTVVSVGVPVYFVTFISCL